MNILSVIRRFCGTSCCLMSALVFVCTLEMCFLPVFSHAAGTDDGEIENRAAPVGRRVCLGGLNAGNLCNDDAVCPGSTCKDRNVFNITVAMEYNAPAADITDVQNLITAASEAIFDITDGQAEIGQATIHNNAFSTTRADLRVYPSTNPTWWQALAGFWHNGGNMHVSIDNIQAAVNPGPVLAHEFAHLVFDCKDEYESRPDCGNNTGNANCPDAAAVAIGEHECLMDSNNTELCWGHGDPSNLTDLTGGNHDATNVTEQSQCRDGRSCWEQVVWSWPSTFIKPVGAPDPGAHGAVVNPTHFIVTENTVRVVLVLDESGSMDLETPKRIERLKVAANDFISMASDDVEVGIVSYASDAEIASGRVIEAIDDLGTNRGALTAAISGLSPSTRTNIGDGLEKAKDLIIDAGGVTGNTFVVLMTDGKNNEPRPLESAEAHLNTKVAELLAANIPVYVTCTGSDLGLSSQCAEIADGTNGFYVDSADAARLPEAFVGFHESIAGYQPIDSAESDFAKIKSFKPKVVYVDEGSESATFTLLWHDPAADAVLSITDPDGQVYQAVSMPQGRYATIKDPKPGNWLLSVDPRGGASGYFVVRSFTQNRTNTLGASVRYPSVMPGEEIYVYAYPRSSGGAITHPDEKIVTEVTLPDGSKDLLELYDRGRDLSGRGDDLPADGIFTGVYKNTAMKGPYRFLVKADIDRWSLGQDAHKYKDAKSESTHFIREVLLSASVGDPDDVVLHPEDDPQGQPGQGPFDDICFIMNILILLLLIIIILMIWRCCCMRRLKG